MSTKLVKEVTAPSGPEDLSEDLLEVLLQEAERALLLVDARLDEPGCRVLSGVAPEEGSLDERCAEFSLAIAELVDDWPALPGDLELVADRARTLGASAGTEALASFPQLMDLVRLSLEGLFRLCPDVSAYATWLPDSDFFGEIHSPQETYEALSQIRALLRDKLN